MSSLRPRRNARREPEFVLDVEALLTQARRRTGLSDFGDESFREGLERLVTSVNDENDLNDFGAGAFRELVLHALVNRLEIEDWYRRHPEIDDEVIDSPLFIVGLPRTGSTLLGYHLALDPATRTFRLWESEKPTPPPIAGQDADDPRIVASAANHEALVKVCPAIALMVPYDPRGPVECYELFYLSFHYAHFDMYVRCPSYTEWFLAPERDHTAAYRYHKRVLKLLQWRSPPKRWCLKMPSHSLMIEGLDKVYPDARFVMTHRDPVKAIASASHLNVTVRKEFSKDPAKLFFGAHEARMWHMATERLLAFRSTNEARFFDLYHAQQLRDALPRLIALYEWLGWPMTADYRDRFHAWRQSNPKANNPYRLEDYGLDEAELRQRFSAYIERFFTNAA
jgi:hypothetical protein